LKTLIEKVDPIEWRQRYCDMKTHVP